MQSCVNIVEQGGDYFTLLYKYRLYLAGVCIALYRSVCLYYVPVCMLTRLPAFGCYVFQRLQLCIPVGHVGQERYKRQMSVRS
jgi:hypothetical protein